MKYHIQKYYLKKNPYEPQIQAYFILLVWQCCMCELGDYADMHNLSGISFKVTASQCFKT